MANTWFEKKEQRKITYSISGNETEIKVFKRRESHSLGIATSAGG